MIVVRPPTASAWPPGPFDVDTLRSQFQTFMHSLQSIIDVQDEDQRPFYLSEIQFARRLLQTASSSCLALALAFKQAVP